MKLSGDSHAVQTLVYMILPQLYLSVITAVGSLIACFVINWELAILLSGCVCLLFILGFLYGIYGKSSSRAFRGSMGKLLNVSYEMFVNTSLIHQFGTNVIYFCTIVLTFLKSIEIEDYNTIVNETTKINNLIQVISSIFYTLASGVTLYSRVLLLWAGGILILVTSTTTGNVLTVLFLASICMQSAYKGFTIYGNLQMLIGSLERLFYLFEYQPKTIRSGSIIQQVEGTIEFENVCFSYPTRRDVTVLHMLNLTASPCKIVGIYGKSGSGKSTIAALLAQWYRPSSGYILLDDMKINSLDPFWLRKQVFVLNQESSAIFPDTIAANIVSRNL